MAYALNINLPMDMVVMFTTDGEYQLIMRLPQSKALSGRQVAVEVGQYEVQGNELVTHSEKLLIGNRPRQDRLYDLRVPNAELGFPLAPLKPGRVSLLALDHDTLQVMVPAHDGNQPVTKNIHGHDAASDGEQCVCAGAFWQADGKMHNGTYAFTHSSQDATQYDTSVAILAPNRLVMGALSSTAAEEKLFEPEFGTLVQSDYNQVTFTAFPDETGYNAIPHTLNKVPKSLLLDIHVEDMPRDKKAGSGVGLYIAKLPMDGNGRPIVCQACLLTSDGWLLVCGHDKDDLTLLSQAAFSAITSATNTLTLTQEVDHTIAININGRMLDHLKVKVRSSPGNTMFDFDMTKYVGAFIA